jgi:acylphosphatase
METKSLAKRNSKMEVVAPAAPTPLTLLQQAIAQGMDLAQLEKLMEMQERWEKRQAEKAFRDAMTTFQSMAPVIKKNRTAKINSQKGNYSYKFADLGAIAGQIKGALKECGLSYRWEFKDNAGKLEVTCFISHRDGHTETTVMEAGKDMSGGKNDIQQIGSTQTYLQRYTLIGALGLSTADEDNDGRGHSEPPPAQTEEEILAQWQQSVNGVTSRVELNGLYVKNRKAVDGNDKVKAIFKARQEQLPLTNKTVLP